MTMLAERLILKPALDVAEAEYRRLLGYPRDHEPSSPARDLADAARAWVLAHAQPWIYLREVAVETHGAETRFDGQAWVQTALPKHLATNGAARAVLFAASAGAAVELRARELWQEGKPDEYFFIEMFGSAVVEQLVTRANELICAEAGGAGLSAIPHYSPGYDGWDVAEQVPLFHLLQAGRTQPLPETIEVLPSGMLRPKKSLLGVVGLSSAPVRAEKNAPCERCSLMPCRYRRSAYRHAGNLAPADGEVINEPASMAAPGPLAPTATYRSNPRALSKWATERLALERIEGGRIRARFRYDGTTCSNMGRPLAFDYVVTLGTATEGYPILNTSCAPASHDDGHVHMCEYRRDPEALMAAIANEQPLRERSLNDVLAWARPTSPSGCFCDAGSRMHKWGLVLETIHFALARDQAEIARVGRTVPREPRLGETPRPTANPTSPAV